MRLFILSALLAAAAAQPPVWWDPNQCGVSMYADAGEGCPLSEPGPCQAVVGGIPAREHEFPYTASLRTSGHFCGGVLISDTWVLTAAHCTIGDQPGDFTVVLGGVTRVDTHPDEVEYETISVIEHPDYNGGDSTFDVSLVELAETVSISDHMRPACAPDPNDLYEGAHCEISGWGALDSGGASPNQLYYTTVQVTTNAYCNLQYPGQITDDMICASDTGTHDDRDTCQGDSGGPMAVKDGNGQFHVVGLTSWGIGCASGYPGVYNRPGHAQIIDWITEHVNAASPK